MDYLKKTIESLSWNKMWMIPLFNTCTQTCGYTSPISDTCSTLTHLKLNLRLHLRVVSTIHMRRSVFHWHIVEIDSFPLVLDSFPELSRNAAFSSNQVYTKAQVAEIVEHGEVDLSCIHVTSSLVRATLRLKFPHSRASNHSNTNARADHFVPKVEPWGSVLSPNWSNPDTFRRTGWVSQILT